MRATSPSPTCSRPKSLGGAGGPLGVDLDGGAQRGGLGLGRVAAKGLLNGQQQGIKKGPRRLGAEVDSAAASLLVAWQTQHLHHVGHQPGMGRGVVDRGGQALYWRSLKQMASVRKLPKRETTSVLLTAFNSAAASRRSEPHRAACGVPQVQRT